MLDPEVDGIIEDVRIHQQSLLATIQGRRLVCRDQLRISDVAAIRYDLIAVSTGDGDHKRIIGPEAVRAVLQVRRKMQAGISDILHLQIVRPTIEIHLVWLHRKEVQLLPAPDEGRRIHHDIDLRRVRGIDLRRLHRRVVCANALVLRDRRSACRYRRRYAVLSGGRTASTARQIHLIGRYIDTAGRHTSRSCRAGTYQGQRTRQQQCRQKPSCI